MKSMNNEFPNPILADGRDDYIGTCFFRSSFDEAEIKVTQENIIIPFTYFLSCNGLQALISSQKAKVVIRVKSSAASYSRLFQFPYNSNTYLVQIPKYDVVEKIEIGAVIIAAEDINQFSCPDEFNKLYFEGAVFDIRKGDILGTEDTRIIYIDDTELEKPISSIFTINKVPNQEDDVMPEFDDEKIIVNLKEPVFDLYYHFKDFNNGSLRRYSIGIIVYPVLVEAITKICESYKDIASVNYTERRWFRTIEHQAEKKGIRLSEYEDSPVTLANKLLGGITYDSFNSFKDTLDNEMNNGETQTIGGLD